MESKSLSPFSPGWLDRVGPIRVTSLARQKPVLEEPFWKRGATRCMNQLFPSPVKTWDLASLFLII